MHGALPWSSTSLTAERWLQLLLVPGARLRLGDPVPDGLLPASLA